MRTPSVLRWCLLTTAVVVTVSVFPTDVTAQEPRELILGASAMYESGTMSGEEIVSVQERDQSFEYRNAHFVSTRLLYLRPRSENSFTGFGVEYINNYRGALVEDGQTVDPTEHYEFGPLLEGLGVYEKAVALGDESSLRLGGQTGVAVLFPRGDFAREIRSLQDQNVRTQRIPRVGAGLGAHVAVLRQLDERLTLRFELAAQYQKIFLFHSTQNIDDVEFRKRWTTGALRTRMGLSLQIDL